jgi:hypothetical protein
MLGPFGGKPRIIFHGATASSSTNPFVVSSLNVLKGYQTVNNKAWPFFGEYFLSGTSHQDAARLLGSIAPPSQVLGNHWQVLGTTGLFGSYGGRSSLPLWINRQFGRY